MDSLRWSISKQLLCGLLLFVALSSAQLRQEDAIKGNNKTLTCSTNRNTDVNIVWLTKTLIQETATNLLPSENNKDKYEFKNSKPLTICNGVTACYKCSEGGECSSQLTVYNLEVVDSGEYVCHITDIIGGAKETTRFELDVLHKPENIKLEGFIVGHNPYLYNLTEGTNPNQIETTVAVQRNKEIKLVFTVEKCYPEADIKCTNFGNAWEAFNVVQDPQTRLSTTTQDMIFTPTATRMNDITCEVTLQHVAYPAKRYTIKIDIQYKPEGAITFSMIKPEQPTADENGINVYELKVDDVLEFDVRVGDAGNPRGRIGLLKEGEENPSVDGITQAENSDRAQFTVSRYEHQAIYRAAIFNTWGHVAVPQEERFRVKVIGVEPPGSSSAGLGGGAIAGIVIAAIVIIALVITFTTWYFVYYKKTGSKSKPNDFDDPAAGQTGGVGSGKGKDDHALAGVITEKPGGKGGSVDGLNKQDPYESVNNNPYDLTYTNEPSAPKVEKDKFQQQSVHPIDDKLHYAEIDHKSHPTNGIHRNEEPVIYSQVTPSHQRNAPDPPTHDDLLPPPPPTPPDTPPPSQGDLKRTASETQI